MPDSKPPLLGKLWSVVWLILIGTVAVWMAVQLLATIWVWLLVAVVIVGAAVGILAWMRFRNDRW